MQLLVNSLIERLSNAGRPLVVRLLYLNPRGDRVAVIDVDNRSAEPVWHERAELEKSLASGTARVLELDHAGPPAVREEELSDKDRKFRDRTWQSIAPLCTGENSELMLYPRDRARLIEQRVAQTGVSRKTLYKRVRRYWQGGQTHNTQLPHHRYCGGKGKERRVSKGKLGRPSLRAKAEQRAIGVNIDANLRKTIIAGGIMFYEHSREATYEKAYQRTLAHFCKRGYETINGVKVPILPPVDEIFTLNQFKYHYQQDRERRLREALTARFGERRVKLRYREVTGSSVKEAFGPGSLFQIDATVADVYLVSRRNRNQIIGRPVIYVIIDVFSRMIVGVCVRMEREGWLGVMLAIENATTDKVAFCAQYGIVITDQQWPVRCLPERLIGDRGPLECDQADHLVGSLNIEIENTPPYRADWKGIVEQFFNYLNIRILHELPGAVKKERERGEVDYRLEAALDIHEFTEIVVRCVIYHNNEHRMDWYDLDEYLIRDEVPPYPIDLFTWGIANRQGLLRTRDPELIRVNLLPSEIATVTEKGIRFRGLFYTCDQAQREDWYLKARNTGRWKVRAAYDPRCTSVIWLRPDASGASVRCEIATDSAFKDCDWGETETQHESQRIAAQQATTRRLQADVTLAAEITHIVKGAAERTTQARVPGQSKRARTKDIRRHGSDEIDRIQRIEAAQLYTDDSHATAGTPLTDIEADEVSEYIPFPHPTNLRNLRERMMKNEPKPD